MADEDVSSVSEVEPLILPKNDPAHPGGIICPLSSPPTPIKDRSRSDSQSSIDDKTTSTNEILIV
jgi:hypothetical protein